MSTLTRVRSQLLSHPRRLVSVLLTILIGVGFTAACITYNATTAASLERVLAGPGRTADLIISPATAQLGAISSVSGVGTVENLVAVSAGYRAPSAKGYLTVDSLPSQGLRWFDLTSGTWPTGSQVIAGERFAREASLRIGSTFSIDGSGGSSRTVTIAGLYADDNFDAAAYAPAALVAALGGQPEQTLVRTAAGVDPQQVRTALTAALPPPANSDANAPQVLTGDEFAAQRKNSLTDGTDLLGLLLLGFASIALLVAGLVIANIFTILVTARRRELALLRCIGATAGQVTSQVLLEGLVLGIVGSLAGIFAGWGAGSLMAQLLGTDSAGTVIDPPGMTIALVLGILVTVGAATFPAVRTARVSPLAALSPIDPEPVQRRSSRLRATFGVLLTGAGAGGLVYGAKMGSVVPAIGAGAVSAVGILLLTRSVLPWVLRGLRPMASLFGTPGRLAGTNVIRTPGRSAATSAALLVGVALICTLQVGAASASATLDAALDGRFPVPFAVADSSGAALPASVEAGVRSAGLAAGAVHGATIATRSSSPDVASRLENSGPTNGKMQVIAPSTQALDAAGVGLAAGDVQVPSWWLDGQVAVGGSLTLTAGGHTATLRIVDGHLASASGAQVLVVNPTVLATLVPQAPVVGWWAALPAGADAVAVNSALQRATSSLPDVRVTGSALERAQYQSALGTVLTIATALLAVAVLIAMVGIAGTLSLSVLERTRESALLRALGLRRSGLRSMIAVEALLLAAVGSVVGAALGIGYGLAGSAAATGAIGRSVTYAVPWGQIALVIGVALAAGLLASVLPARAAARVSPALALADLG